MTFIYTIHDIVGAIFFLGFLLFVGYLILTSMK